MPVRREPRAEAPEGLQVAGNLARYQRSECKMQMPAGSSKIGVPHFGGRMVRQRACLGRIGSIPQEIGESAACHMDVGMRCHQCHLEQPSFSTDMAGPSRICAIHARESLKMLPKRQCSGHGMSSLKPRKANTVRQESLQRLQSQWAHLWSQILDHGLPQALTLGYRRP